MKKFHKVYKAFNYPVDPKLELERLHEEIFPTLNDKAPVKVSKVMKPTKVLIKNAPMWSRKFYDGKVTFGAN